MDDGRFEHFDARPGGSYRLVLAYADASARGKSAVDSDVVDAMGGHPSTPDHASTSGLTMRRAGSTLQITRRDCRPRWTISPLALNAERRLPRSTVLVATATIRVVAAEGQIYGR
jgi:hypothetical protein